MDNYNKGMLYTVGSYIDLTQKKDTPQKTVKKEIDWQFFPGTTVKFIDWLTAPKTLIITPT